MLLGLLGYSCKIHRKRSKTTCNRLSFSESDERKFERSFSNEDNKREIDAGDDHSKANSSEPLASTSTGQGEGNTEEDKDLPARCQTKEKQANQTSGRI